MTDSDYFLDEIRSTVNDSLSKLHQISLEDEYNVEMMEKIHKAYNLFMEIRFLLKDK